MNSRAGHADAVLAGERPVEFTGQGRRRLRDLAELGDVFRAMHVDDGTYMNETGRGVAIE